MTQNNQNAVNAAIDARIASKNAAFESGAIAQHVRDNNVRDCEALRAYFTGTAALSTADAYGLDVPALLSKLADKTCFKFRELLKTLETGTDRLGSYLRPVLATSILFDRKNVAYDNKHQQATLSPAIDAEHSAKIKARKHYKPGTACAQTSQCRRLLIDSGLATGNENESAFILKSDHPAIVSLVEIMSRKK